MSQFHEQILCYAEISHPDWLKIVMVLGTANQSAWFQGSVAILLWNLFMRLALDLLSIWGWTQAHWIPETVVIDLLISDNSLGP